MKKKRNIINALSFTFTIIFVTFSFLFTSCTSKSNYTYIIKIIDGDTFEDNKNIRYRLLGVDTPESFDSSNHFKPTSGIQKFYAEKATNLSLTTIRNKNIEIKKWKLDIYKRVITRINCGSVDLAKLLLSHGLARVKYISPIKGNFYYYFDTDYYNQLIDVENYAKINRIGIWKLSKFGKSMVFPK